MATPNIVNVTSITPFTINGAVTTSNQDIIDVAADKVYKLNTILIANIDGTNAADISVSISTDNGAVELYHDNTARIATNSTGANVTGALTEDSNRVATNGRAIAFSLLF